MAHTNTGESFGNTIMIDDLIYSDGDEITISKTRAQFGNKIYAIANISSIELRHDQITISNDRQPPVLATIGGGIVGLIVGNGLAFLVPSTNFDDFGAIVWILGGCVLGYELGRQARQARQTEYRDQYTVVITSTSGEVEALTTGDEAQAASVVRALDQAISA